MFVFFCCLPHMYSPDTGLQQGPELRSGSHARSRHSLTHKRTEVAAHPPHVPPHPHSRNNSPALPWQTGQQLLGGGAAGFEHGVLQGSLSQRARPSCGGKKRRPVQATSINRGATADLPRTSTHHRGSPLASTWIRAGDGRQNEHSLYFNRFG